RSLGNSAFFVMALPYVFLMCAGSISSTIPDIPGDRASGKNTTAVRFGAKNAQILATLFTGLALAVSLRTGDPFAAFSAAAAFPLYLLYLIKPVKLLEESTYKIGGLFCMAAAAALSPWFVAFSAGVVFATWIYFRYRHGVVYPSLVPQNATVKNPDRTDA
ncbi:MAG: UbiA family prenyltransferase, partial [Chitinispirillaceae bacterium]|nr:UbiA family prenyltransferase [Chitinispirillaceae bacterium]